MPFLVEMLLEFVGELLLQLFAEVLVEFGLRSLSEPFRTRSNPWLAAVGYLGFGAVAGALSLWLRPTLMIASPLGRLVGLGLTPVFAGCAMAALGAWRRRHDQELVRIDRFAYGYLFALGMALVRYRFGT